MSFGGNLQPWHAFQNHALNVLELLKSVSEDNAAIERRVTLEGEEHIDRALARGNGLILTTFHSGNWELAGLLLALRGYPLTTIAGEQLRRGWSDEVKSLKRRFGIKVVSQDGSLRELYRDLRANRVVALHIDGDMYAGGHDVSFLGKRITVPRGPSHLSRVLGAPTALAYCRRTDRHRLHLCIEPLDDPPQSPEDEEALTRRLMAGVEKCILEAPGQWCIFRRLSP